LKTKTKKELKKMFKFLKDSYQKHYNDVKKEKDK